MNKPDPKTRIEDGSTLPKGSATDRALRVGSAGGKRGWRGPDAQG